MANILQTLLSRPIFDKSAAVSSLLGSMLSGIAPPPYSTMLNLTVPSALPLGVSPPIEPTFPGFAFEQASFYNYSFDASGNPNTFSENLINSVYNRTGGTPILRVGGTSGDFGHYSASQTDICNRPATRGGPAFGKPYLSIGPSYFDAFKNFPGAQYVFMVPLEHRNLNNSLQWASQGLDAIGDRLQALEIGNEPDLYSWFSVDAYVNAFNMFEQALSARFPDQLGGRIYQALGTAAAASAPASELTVEDALNAGINSTGKILQVAYHLYQRADASGTSIADLQKNIANHTAITNAMAYLIPNIKYLQSQSPETPFILSEVGNSLGNRHILARNVLATALWNLDYQLYAMVIGVTRVNNQQIVLPGFQMWEPVQSDFTKPLVRANYYSQPLVADFIGTATSYARVPTHVIELPTGEDLLSAYAAYDLGLISRIVVVNQQLWTSNSSSIRPVTELIIDGLPSVIHAARISVLTSPDGAFAMDTLTYAGLQWTYENDGLEQLVGPGPSTIAVRDGVLRLGVEATSAVLIQFLMP